MQRSVATRYNILEEETKLSHPFWFYCDDVGEAPHGNIVPQILEAVPKYSTIIVRICVAL